MGIQHASNHQVCCRTRWRGRAGCWPRHFHSYLTDDCFSGTRDTLERKKKAEPWKNHLHCGLLMKQRRLLKKLLRLKIQICKSNQVLKQRTAASLVLGQFSTGGGISALQLHVCSVTMTLATKKMETVYKSIWTGWKVSLKPSWMFFRDYPLKTVLVSHIHTTSDSFKPTCFNTSSARYKKHHIIVM